MRKSYRTWLEERCTFEFWDTVNELFGQSQWVKFALNQLSTNIYESVKFQLQSYFYFCDAEQISVLGGEDNAGINQFCWLLNNPADYGDDGDDDKDGDDGDDDKDGDDGDDDKNGDDGDDDKVVMMVMTIKMAMMVMTIKWRWWWWR